MAPAQVDIFVKKVDEFLKQLATYATDLEKNACPKTDPAITAWYKKQGDFIKQLEVFKKAFSDKKTESSKQLDISQYKNFATDLSQLEGFGKAYTINGSLGNLNTDTMKMLEVDLKANADLVNSIPKTYALIIKLGSPEGAKLQKAYAGAVKAMQGYLAKREELIKEAKTKGPELLQQASSRASQAKAGKQVAMFRQAENCLEQVQNYINHVGLMDYSVAKEVVKTLSASLVAGRKELVGVKKDLQETMLAETSAPNDVYSEKDKAAIADAVSKAWKKKYPKDDILGIRFPNKAWVRDSIWRWNGATKSWYNNDTSVLRLNVVVKTDAKIATIYQAYVNRDNNSETVNVGVDTKGSEYVVSEMLLKNWDK